MKSQLEKSIETLENLISPDRRVKGAAKAADPNSKRTAKRRKKIENRRRRLEGSEHQSN